MPSVAAGSLAPAPAAGSEGAASATATATTASASATDATDPNISAAADTADVAESVAEVASAVDAASTPAAGVRSTAASSAGGGLGSSATARTLERPCGATARRVCSWRVFMATDCGQHSVDQGGRLAFSATHAGTTKLRLNLRRQTEDSGLVRGVTEVAAASTPLAIASSQSVASWLGA